MWKGEVAHTEEHLVIFAMTAPYIPLSYEVSWSLFQYIRIHFNVLFKYSKQWLVIIFLKDEYLYAVQSFLNH